MRRLRLTVTFLASIAAMLLFADPALAITHGGQGIYGTLNDTEITNTMFLLIGAIPVLIIVLSIIQGWSDNRRHHKEAAEKAARAADPVQRGW
jgi:hypothetical protein